MTENEKRLRRLVCISGDAERALDTLLVETRQSARDAALEEAARGCVARAKTWAKKVYEAHAKDRDDLAMEAGASACALHDQARDTRALKSQPARRYLDAENVREEVALPLLRAFASMEVGSYVWSVTRDVLDGFRRIGLDLDAAPKPTQPREYATVENGLLPAPRKP